MGRVIDRINALQSKYYIFFTTITFYFLLWFINPDNKIIVISFLFLPIVYYWKLRNIRISLVFAYLASLIIFIGKRYFVQLIPPGIYSLKLYPLGYIMPFVISPKHILAFIMLLVMARDLIKFHFKLINIKTADIILLIYFFWVLTTDFLVSKRPEISLLFSLSTLHILVMFFFLRIYIKSKGKFLSLLLWFIASQVFFESLISIFQFQVGGPIFKNLEEQVGIEHFGEAPDELEFTFRPVGTFFHANALGLWLSFCLTILISGLFKETSQIIFLSLIFGIIALLTTLSRSSWLGLFGSSTFVLFILQKVKKMKTPEIFTKYIKSLFIILGLTFMIFVFPRAEKSLYSFGLGGGGGYLRTMQIEEMIQLINQNLFLGVGTLMSVQEGLLMNPSGIFSQVPLSVHNWYFLLIAEHGIPAFLLFAAFMILFIRNYIKRLGDAKMVKIPQLVTLGLFGGVVSLSIIALFQPFISEEFILLTLALLPRSLDRI